MLNSIPFSTPTTSLTCSFYTNRQEGFSSIYISDELIPLLNGYKPDPSIPESRWLYTDFQPPREGAILASINLTEHLQFAEHYYRYLISTYFRSVAPVMRRSFTKDVEVWLLDTTSHHPEYDQYCLFTLVVQHNTEGSPMLTIAYDGRSRILKKSMQDCNIDTLLNPWMLYKGFLYKWGTSLPDEAMLHLDEVYPLLSNKLGTELEIVFPARETINRYPLYYKLIQGFYAKYLNQPDFLNIIPLSPKGFIIKTRQEHEIISGEAGMLEYGEKNLGLEPKYDLKSYGPYATIPKPQNVKLFFIYQKGDEPYVQRLKDAFDNGIGAAKGIKEYIKVVYTYKDEWNISFTHVSDAVKTCLDALKNRQKELGVKYLIIYISPIGKMEKHNPEHLRTYYRLKDMFLFYEYQSQVIFKNNIVKSNFQYFLPNIMVAMLAKLGGVPWRLNRTPANELIVGIGAAYVKHAKSRMLGSAFCFDNEGKFQHFNAFPADNTKSLAGSIHDAVVNFTNRNPNATRLIIHFYKVISKAELKPILDTLYALDVSIPVIVLTINRTASKNILAFDISDPSKNLMPYSGTYVQIAERQYLLFNNARYKEDSVPGKKDYKFPVKIKITSTQLELLNDPELIKLLIDQVYQFSRMYWKSISQQNMPVTIMYPEMVAEIFPYFKNPVLTDFGKESLWFL